MAGAAFLLLDSGDESDGSLAERPEAARTSAATPVRKSAAEAELDADPAIPGRYVPPHPGPDGRPGTGDERLHIIDGSWPICTAEQLAANRINECYHSNPPTSGIHAPSATALGVLANPATKEQLVHSMEHGAVVVWHNTRDEAVIGELRAIVQAALAERRLVVMSAYAGMEAETIAVTSWTRIDKFPVSQFTPRRVRQFIEINERRFNPEGF